MLVPGHERMEKELRQIRENIAESGKPNDEDLKKLGALEAVKNAESDEDDERGHLTAVTDGMIAGYMYMERDPAECSSEYGAASRGICSGTMTARS